MNARKVNKEVLFCFHIRAQQIIEDMKVANTTASIKAVEQFRKGKLRREELEIQAHVKLHPAIDHDFGDQKLDQN